MEVFAKFIQQYYSVGKESNSDAKLKCLELALVVQPITK